MRRLRSFLIRLAAVFNGARRDRDLAAELEAHLQLHVDDNLRAGMTPAEARRHARVRLGGVDQVKERYRDQRGIPMLEAWLKDLRYSLRGLRNAPTFTAMAVATLALGIGANTAIYTVVDCVLLRPLPYPDPHRLATIARNFLRNGSANDSFSQNGLTWFALREGASLIDVAASNGGPSGVNLVAGGQTAFVQQQRVTDGFFRVLGVPPALGREFTADEDRVNGPPAAILSHALWTRAFGGDPGVIGRPMMLRGEPYTIVGVMPAGFRSNAVVDVWTPLRPSTRGEGSGQNYTIIARLRPGAAWGDADGQVASIGTGLLKSVPVRAGVRVRMQLAPLQQERTADLRQPLWILWGAVGMVLLVACVNIAGLLLARAAVRAPETAMRMALGGGRAAIVRYLLAESLVLAACGGLCGIAVGQVILHTFASQLETLFGGPIALDVRVLLVSGAAALLTSIVFGLFPAIHSSRADIRPVLGQSGGPTVAGASSRWPRRALVVTQVALCVALVFGAGLLVRTLQRLTQLRPGFDATHVITATLSLQDARYETNARVNQLFDRSLDGIRQVPGVERAAVALTLPYERALNEGFRFVGEEMQPEVVNLTYVTPEYFDALRIPIRHGRLFVDTDNRASLPVAVVNEAFVRRYSPTGDPVGRQLSLGTIVGVVGDIQQRAGWGDYGPVAAIPAAYVPAAQFADAGFKLVHTWFSPSWIVRTTGPQQGIIQQIQQAVQKVDPQLPFKAFRTLDDVRAEAVAVQRVQAQLIGSLSALALLLAAVGISGLTASGVTERTRELGIRIALGATPMQTVRAAGLPAVRLAAVGVAIGLVLARGASGLMRRLVFGVAVTDPATFLLAGGLVLFAASVAALVPSLRILRLNIVTALRRT
jgi:predicted permease